MAKKILVIDDDSDIRDGLKMLLESEGFNVLTSEKGEKAEAFNRSSDLPDLILLDVLLSGKDGRDLSKKLKKQDVTRDIPILLMSAHPGMHLDIKESLADGFIEKPFEIDRLISEVRRYVNA